MSKEQQEGSLNFDLYVDDPATGLRLIKEDISIEEYMDSYIMNSTKEEHVARKPDTQNGGFLYYSLFSASPLERTSKGYSCMGSNKTTKILTIKEALQKRYPLSDVASYRNFLKRHDYNTFLNLKRGDSFDITPFKYLFYIDHNTTCNSSDEIRELRKITHYGGIGVWGYIKVLDVSMGSGLECVYFKIITTNYKGNPLIQFEPHYFVMSVTSLKYYLDC